MSTSTTWPTLTTEALARPRSEPTESFVYFIADLDAQAVKIGVARNVVQRLSALQTATPHTLACLGCLAGDSDLEHELHRLFAADRIRGEWFRVSARLKELASAAYLAATGRPLDGPEGEAA